MVQTLRLDGFHGMQLNFNCNIIYINTVCFTVQGTMHPVVNASTNTTQNKRRWRNGTVVKREIAKLSKSTHSIIPSSPFNRLVREIAGDIVSANHGTKEFNFKTNALCALKESSEQMLSELFMKADVSRAHSRRKTMHIDDIKFAKYITSDTYLLSDACMKMNGLEHSVSIEVCDNS